MGWGEGYCRSVSMPGATVFIDTATYMYYSHQDLMGGLFQVSKLGDSSIIGVVDLDPLRSASFF